jgi:hypothetical protein
MNDRSTSTSTEQNEAVGSTTALPVACQSNNSHFTVSNSKRVRQVNSISNITINVNGAQFKDQINAARDLGATALNSALFERIERLFLDADGNILNRSKSLFDHDLTENKGNFFYMVY